jgi:hypothetical protein|tara:strand:+ start:30 stop:182 length:153 start_codon:yes stop_codon:yes gene_type:complete
MSNWHFIINGALLTVRASNVVQASRRVRRLLEHDGGGRVNNPMQKIVVAD